jgi:hypothetical protein
MYGSASGHGAFNTSLQKANNAFGLFFKASNRSLVFNGLRDI